jgi:hypothetical protein
MSRRQRAQTQKRAPETPPPPKSPTTQAPAWLKPAVLVLSAICLLGLFSTESHDTDFWWHLKTGQYIVQNHKLPVPDPFAYTTAMNPPSYSGEQQVRNFNLTHEWLSQILLYGVYSVGGLPAIVLVRAALLAGICALVGLLAARRTGKFYAGIAAAFATASLATVVTIDRPMIVTFLFSAAFITLVEFRRALWLLPPLALVWANCHGGFFLGWVVLLVYCVAEALPVGTRWSVFKTRSMAPREARRLWLVTACAIAASALNPNGLAVVSILFRYRQSAMTASNIEWHRPYLWGSPYSFDLLLYAAALVLIVSWRKVWRVDWLLFAAFTVAALLAFRNILLIGIVAPIAIATYFPFRFRIPRMAVWAAPTLLVSLLGIGVINGWFFQLRPDMWRFPVGAADYLLTHHLPGPLFNTYEHGGYLMWRLWPGYKVFIDGRALSEAAYKDYSQILAGGGSAEDKVAGPRAELLNHYGVRTVVMNTFQYNTGAVYTLAEALANPATADWQLVYDDAQSLIFVLQPPPGTPAFADKAQHMLEHLETECTTNIEHSPLAYNCAKTLADFWLRANDAVRARRMLRLYLDHTLYRDVEAENIMRQLGGGSR